NPGPLIGTTPLNIGPSVNTDVAATLATGSYQCTITFSGSGTTSTAALSLTLIVSSPSTAAPQRISAVEDGIVRTGYVEITPDTNTAAPLATLTFGLVQNSIVQAQAGLVSSSVTTKATVFINRLASANRSVGIAIANPGNSIAILLLTLRDVGGATIGTA